MRDGSDAVVFGYGPWLLANAFEAAEEVEQSSGASVRLVNLPWLNRVDPRWLREVIGGRRYILTLDNHYLKGGQGEMLATAIAELALEPTPRILRVGVTVASRVRHQRRSARPPQARCRQPREEHALRRPSDRMTVLFWDIDGTLLTTGKAGVPAWEEAVREVVGHDFQLSKFRIAGLTDYQIAVRTFEMLGVDVDEDTIRRMVKRYEELLPEALPLKQGRVLPNVREILELLERRTDVRSYLLTGNTRGGARAKLTHYDLVQVLPGRRVRRGRQRAVRHRRASARSGAARGPVNDRAVFVVGDTPHDIHCANAIGARTVAVATGGYSLDELESHHPWRAFAELPPADEFERLIDEARARSRSTTPVAHEARHPAVSTPLARVTAGAALVLRPCRRLPGLAQPDRVGGGVVAVGPRRRAGWSARVDGDLHRFVRPRRNARERRCRRR